MAAQTEADKQAVIARLLQTYLTMAIPDSLVQKVQHDVQIKVDTTSIDPAGFADAYFEHDNIFIVETRLRNLRNRAVVARIRGKHDISETLFFKALDVAQQVDAGKGVEYWVPVLWDISGYHAGQARNWLSAMRAADLSVQCTNFDHIAAVFYAALSLQYLQHTPDLRIEIDTITTLQNILYLYHGLFELSLALSEQPLLQAVRIKDYLRANGIRHLQGETLKQEGKTRKAYEVFTQLYESAEQHEAVPFMSWHIRNSLLHLGELHWQLADYQRALMICARLDSLELSDIEMMNLKNLKGLIYRSLGSYGLAKEMYVQAMSMAEKNKVVFNQVPFKINMAILYHELTEFDMAMACLDSAEQLMTHLELDFENKAIFSIQLAETYFEMGREDKASQQIEYALDLLSSAKLSPARQANLTFVSAKLYRKIGKLKNAIVLLTTAVNISAENNLARMSNIYKIELARCYVQSGDFLVARRLINQVLESSKDNREMENKIHGLALQFDVARKQSHHARARTTATQLLHGIDRFLLAQQDPDIMPALQQKFYDYLRAMIVYEIQIGRLDSAFAKLSFAKARVMRAANQLSNGVHYDRMDSNPELLKRSLDARSLLLDYLVAEDTLYVFSLFNQQLNLFRSPVSAIQLKADITKYRRWIENTPKLSTSSSADRQSYLSQLTAHSFPLSEVLLPFRKVIPFEDIDNLYVVPDDMLFNLPFASLVIDTSAALTFLADSCVVVRLPSSAFLSAKATNVSSFSPRILISADVTLPGVPDFVDSVRKLFPNTKLLQRNANTMTKDSVFDLLGENHDILIIVGHGYGNERYPDQSFIEFSVVDSSNAGCQTIPISISDLKQAKWHAPGLVMLVGYETGKGKIYQGTGVASLQQSFIVLGAKHVLASFWKIDLQQSLTQVNDFLRTLSRNGDAAQAFGMAQKIVLSRLRRNEYLETNPFYWASFGLMENVN